MPANQYIAGKTMTTLMYSDREKTHAITLAEVRHKRGDSAIRHAVCGMRVMPQVKKKGDRRFLKPFNEKDQHACKTCLRTIISWRFQN